MQQRALLAIIAFIGLSLIVLIFNESVEQLLFAVGMYFGLWGLGFLIWWRLNFQWRFISYIGILTIAATGLVSWLAYFVMGNFFGSTNLSLAIIIGIISLAVLSIAFFLPYYFVMSRQAERSISLLNFLLRLMPNNINFLLWRGVAAHEILDYEAALNDYRKVIQLWGEKKRGQTYVLPALVNRSRIMLGRGLYDAALKDINLALEINANYAHAHQAHAELLESTEDYDLALEAIDDAIALEKNIGFYSKKAEILAALGRKEDALAAIDSAQALIPNETTLSTYRTKVLIDCEDYAGALDYINDYLSKSHDELVNIFHYFNRAQVYRYQSQFSEAMADYQRVLQAKLPKAQHQQLRAVTYFGMGNVHFAEGKYQEAEQEFQQALETWSDYIVAHLGIAACQAAQGQSDLAQETWEKFNATQSYYRNIERLNRQKFFTPELYQAIKVFLKEGLDAI